MVDGYGCPGNGGRGPKITGLGTVRFHGIGPGAIALTTRDPKPGIALAFNLHPQFFHDIDRQIDVGFGNRAFHHGDIQSFINVRGDQQKSRQKLAALAGVHKNFTPFKALAGLAAGLVAGAAGLRDEIYAWPLVNRCRIDQETTESAHESTGTLRAEGAGRTAAGTCRSAAGSRGRSLAMRSRNQR